MAVQIKAYSLDFRQKIIQVYENQKIYQRQLAKRFCVAFKGKRATEKRPKLREKKCINS